nr:MAG TPA: hypothetical protein [Caudoviricetes sp.]
MVSSNNCIESNNFRRVIHPLDNSTKIDSPSENRTVKFMKIKFYLYT